MRPLAVLVLACGFAGAAESAAPSPAPPDTAPVARMNIPQAMLALARGEIVPIDVRGAGHRALGHIKGDVHLPIEAVAGRLSEFSGKKKLVFYCSCHAEELALDVARMFIRSGNTSVAVLVGGYDRWREAGGPIQVDATWEDVFRVDAPPTGWGKTPVDTLRCRYSRDDSVASRGRSSARIVCLPDSAARGFAGYTQRLDAGGLRGRPVTLTAMVRSEGVERGAFLWIAAEDSAGRVMMVTKPEQDPIVDTQDWRLAEVTGVIPKVTHRVLIGISLTTSGRVWLDEVRLVAPEQGPYRRLRPVVANYGFED